MKLHINELAVFGGSPAFPEPLHVGRPNIGDRERLLERINNLLDRKWLTNDGPYVQEFERRIMGITGVKHCIAMCSGTVAMEIAIRALGLTDEVVVPAFTFVATAHALQWQEITPVFCDVNLQTHNIDPSRIERVITHRTTGIIGVHLWGRPCDVAALTAVARRHNLKLLFDAAHAFGSSYEGGMIGNFGDAEVFSFHATKFVNTFEGGAIVTNEDHLATKIRLMKNFGFDGYDSVIYVGTNGKMSEVAAAMGLTSLESLEQFVAVGYRNYKEYEAQLNDVPGIRLLTHSETERCNYQYIVLEVDAAVAQISRDTLHQILWAEGVLARRYFYPGCHRMEPYRSVGRYAPGALHNTDCLAECVLCLPTGMAVAVDDISEICQILRLAVAHGAEIRKRLLRDTRDAVEASSETL